MILPDASLPRLDPSVAVVTYHARTSDLDFGVVSCDKTDLCLISATRNFDILARNLLLYASKRAKVTPSDANHTYDRSK